VETFQDVEGFKLGRIPKVHGIKGQQTIQSLMAYGFVGVECGADKIRIA
jgi:hypothetical protein